MERGKTLLERKITWECGYGRPSYGMIRPQWRPGCRRYKEIQLEIFLWVLGDNRVLDGLIAGQ